MTKTNLEDVLHVVFKWIDGVVGEDQQIFDQIEPLNLVVNDLLLERIERRECAGCLCRTGGGSEYLRVWRGGRCAVDDGKPRRRGTSH